jgi:hypothetical protein
MKRARTIGWVVVAIAFHAPVLGAQTSGPEPVMTPVPGIARAVRALPSGLKLDGHLTDPAWATAEPFGGFVQRDPNEGQAASEPTEFRVLYTDDALWIGVRATDSKAGQIAALLARRDESSPSDEVTVMIDSYRDRRTGFQFSVNAAGVKRDAYLYNDWDRDDRWDAVWDAKVSIDEAGWSAEFRIPLSQIRFSATHRQAFGFNVSRRVNRLNENQFWRLIPRQASGFVSLFGELTGIDGLRPPRQLEILPYTAASNLSRPSIPNDPFATGITRRANLGGDLKIGISSALTLTATINPDFGQVEADPAVVNLSAFETFYPERRPFFTEGLDLFRFRIADGDGDGSSEELFYTRRIGRAPQGYPNPRGGFAEKIDRTTILSAAKLTGKSKSGWSVGVLGAVTDREDARVVDAGGRPFVDPVEPASTYGVARVEKALRGGRTVIGLFGTMVERSLPAQLQFLHSSAYAGGLNWIHRFGQQGYEFNGRFATSMVSGSPEALLLTQQSSARYFQRPDADYVEVDSSRTSLGGYTLAMNGGKLAGNWRWNVGLDARSPGFEVNDVGYMQAADRISQHIWVNRRWLTPGRVFRRFNINLNEWQSYSFGGERRNTGGNVNLNYQLNNYLSGWMGLNRNFGGLSTTALRGGPAFRSPGNWNGWFGFETDGRKTFRGGTSLWARQEDDQASSGFGLNTYLSWRPAPNVDLTLSPSYHKNRDRWQYLATTVLASGPEYLFGELDQTTTSLTLRSNVTFTPSLSLQLYAQPFVSSGRYLGFKRVVAPRAARFADRFDRFTGDRLARDQDGKVLIDIEADGTTDATLANPDFTVLSFRSNVVLRWEYLLGSTLFLVWQHGRSGFDSDGRWHLGSRINDLFRSPAENVLLVKLNYWLAIK